VRKIALTLVLAASPLAFAPAPFPKADRETQRQKALRECVRRLAEFGVSWHVESRNGEEQVRFGPSRPDLRVRSGWVRISDGDLLDALQRVINAILKQNEDYPIKPPRAR
jgi:hypothetical protein